MMNRWMNLNIVVILISSVSSFQPKPFHLSQSQTKIHKAYVASSDTSENASWFATDSLSISQLKAQILQLGAALDRGQAYNPTSGDYYAKNMNIAKDKILKLLSLSSEKNIPAEGDLDSIQGEWELVLTTVKHGIFRSSPFFLAVQEAFEFAEEKGEIFQN